MSELRQSETQEIWCSLTSLVSTSLVVCCKSHSWGALVHYHRSCSWVKPRRNHHDICPNVIIRRELHLAFCEALLAQTIWSMHISWANFLKAATKHMSYWASSLKPQDLVEYCQPYTSDHYHKHALPCKFRLFLHVWKAECVYGYVYTHCIRSDWDDKKDWRSPFSSSNSSRCNLAICAEHDNYITDGS